jgi:ankyrin repeat protein
MNNSTPVHVAAKRGDAQMLEKILTMPEMDVARTINACESATVGGYAAIHHACALGHVEALKVLLKHGASINAKTQTNLKEGALHICCKNLPVAMGCAKVLIDAKIDVNAIDGFGHNATYWATTKGHLEMIRELDLPGPRHASMDEYIKQCMSKPGFAMAKPKEKKAPAKKKK